MDFFETLLILNYAACSSVNDVYHTKYQDLRNHIKMKGKRHLVVISGGF